jgi:hypothetical protein
MTEKVNIGHAWRGKKAPPDVRKGPSSVLRTKVLIRVTNNGRRQQASIILISAVFGRDYSYLAFKAPKSLSGKRKRQVNQVNNVDK